MFKKIFYFILGIPCILIVLLGILGAIITNETKIVLPIFIVLLLIGILLIFLGIKSKSKKRKEQELQETINNSQDTKKQYLINHIDAKHMVGLPLPEEARCTIGFEKNKFSFSFSGNNFDLNFDKITSIDIKTDTEIQQQYVSSAGGAVGGALLFGPLGAMVGGRVKAKRTATVNHYMIFTYKKDNNVDYISFEIPQSCKSKAIDFKRMFENNYKTSENIRVEL